MWLGVVEQPLALDYLHCKAFVFRFIYYLVDVTEGTLTNPIYYTVLVDFFFLGEHAGGDGDLTVQRRPIRTF